MKLVYKFKIQKNNKVKELCIASNNLYNQANYIILIELSIEKLLPKGRSEFTKNETCLMKFIK